jgi:exodeoxyribonuclease V alpha subunit
MLSTYRLSVTTVHCYLQPGVIFSGVTVEEVEKHRIRVVVRQKLTLVVGEVYDVEGHWQDDGQYGRQLHAQTITRQRLSGKLLLPFLRAHLPGIGESRALRLLSTFGDNLSDVLADPKAIPTVAEVISPNLSNYALHLATACHHIWKDYQAEFKAVVWLEQQGVEAPQIARRIAAILGERTVEALERNPYILSTILRWTQIDAVGLRILRARDNGQSPLSAPERLIGAIDSVMQDSIAAGHTAISKDSLVFALQKKLGQPERIIQTAIKLGLKNTAIINGGEIWRAPGCALMEDQLLARFREMLGSQEQGRITIPGSEKLRTIVKETLHRTGTQLHPEQISAGLKVLRQPLSILMGGAGTGKTSTIKAICEVWEALGGRVELVALAGKAALRLNQATGRLARTIYRMLMELQSPDEESRQQTARSADLPQLDDRTLLIIDEASMVDLGQWHQIVQAMSPGCRLLAVGDPAQLPPIGFGLVFHKLAEDSRITTTLRTVHRQTGQSGIPQVSLAIRHQQMPSLEVYQGLAEGVSFLETPTTNVPEGVSKVVFDLGGFNPTNHNLMVVTALNEGSMGVTGLNERFSKLHQKGLGTEPVKGYLGEWFLPGDPVIYKRNNYTEGLFNGSLGHVTETDPYTRTVTAVFDGLEKLFETAQLIDLQLAYALTCHKAQGSQALRVIVPLSPTQMLDPTWLYTAITRAQNQCVIIGERSVLEQALQRPPKFTKRLVGFSHI